jgi:hypothetical protein
MILLFIIAVFIIAAIIAPRFIPDSKKRVRVYDEDKQREVIKEQVVSLRVFRVAARAFCIIIALICFIQTSAVWVGDDEVGHLRRIYWGKQMPPGRIIALPDENGPQARVLTAGFHFLPFIRVIHDLEMLPVMEVTEGHYGFLVAKDGKPMPEGQFIAPGWENKSDMIDALKFMGWTGDRDKYKGPTGVKGPQLTVLAPGKYRVNRYLFSGSEDKSTPVPAGHVAVIKSNVGEDYKGPPILPTDVEASDLSVPIVPRGYRGVWADVKTPGEYYINKKAYDVTLVDTRVQTWKYIGGYTRRIINLVIGDDGKITQEAETIPFPVPEDAADMAIMLRVEGWDVPQDSRVQVQVTPENAPFVVASVGGLEEVENKIITPNYRSIMRNAIAKDVTIEEPILDENDNQVIDEDTKKVKTHMVTRRRKVLDLLYQREELENIVAKQLIPAGAKAGLTVQWVRFGDPGVPPELLIPGKRRQLAKQLEATYAQEKLAQVARVESERERARADQQPVLMESEIGIKVAENKATQREKAGIGEKKFYTELSKGQQAQRDVLGAELTFQLAALKEVLGAAERNPDIVKMPNTIVQGDNTGLSGAAALLGRNNLNIGGLLNTSQAPKK